MSSPFEVVLEFFACFDRGDLARAGQLVADDAVITLFVSGEDPVELRGFEKFVSGIRAAVNCLEIPSPTESRSCSQATGMRSP